MWKGFYSLVKKDFKLMLSSKFFLLSLGSLLLYSCYINFVYINLDQEIYPVYLYDPLGVQLEVADHVITLNTLEDLHQSCADGYSIGIDASGREPEIYMVSSGIASTDNYRTAYALSSLSKGKATAAEIIGTNNKEMKNRREITCEFLFFELAAVGFLSLAAMLFKEKQMGVIKVHGILPVNKSAFIISKLGCLLLADLVFSTALTLINLGVVAGIAALPSVLIQTAILSIIMALVGFLCAIWIPDFKQFSLFYLVLAIFICTPVFLAGQTSITWSWISYNPMYHLFIAMKGAYFNSAVTSGFYYCGCAIAILVLFILAHRALMHEMAKEGA